MKLPELLAPAGDLEKLRVALAFGADAVYLGTPDFSLRVGENKFGVPQIQKAIAICRAAKKKIYLTTNTFPRDHEFKKLENFLAKLKKTPPDAFIFSDLGVLAVLRKFFPKVAKHLSVQANSVNSLTVGEWKKLGVSRVILARELSFAEIKKIVAANPKMEFEVFVHGAICMSYSGRCLLSNFLTERDANRGQCAQPCRWSYSLVEEKRPGEFFPLEEDSAGSYILNSRDLCLLEKIPQLTRAGICSFKIEGRNKSLGYLATIVRAYRQALDDFAAGKKFDRNLWHEILTTGNRDFTLGFFDGSLQNLQNFERSGSENPQNFLGLVEKSSRGKILLTPKNRLQKGDKIEAVPPYDSLKKLEISKIFDEKFTEISAAHGGQKAKVWLEINHDLPQFTLIRKC
ncbi:MAG: U32 family peptidase C-terminal domain-containing protein [Patescibacteria group bacterium]